MSESKFPGPLFDGKIDFTMWQCTIQDVLVRDSLDLALGSSKRGRSRSRGRCDLSGKFRPKDYSNVECYYCGEKGHIQRRCLTMKEDLKSLKEMKGKSKEKTDDSTNYLSDDDLYLMMGPESSNSGWMLDCAASMHICKDRCCFDALQVDGDFGHVIVGNGEKMKIEGVGTARLKTHNGIVKKLSNVRYVPTCGDNIISLGELCSRGYKFIGDRDLCKIFKDGELILQGVKSNHHIFRVDDLKEDMSCQKLGIYKEKLKPKKKQVKFSDEVIELGTLSGGYFCWDIS